MTDFPRASGIPDPDAARLVDQIRAYLGRDLATPADSIALVVGAHHLLDAARDGIRVAMARANDRAAPSYVTAAKISHQLNAAIPTVGKYVREGRALRDAA